MQSNTTSGLAVVSCENQPTARRGVVSGKAGEFLIEALKAQAEAERLSIFKEELADLRYLGRRFCLLKNKIFNRSERRGRRNGSGYAFHGFTFSVVDSCCVARYAKQKLYRREGTESLENNHREPHPMSIPPFTFKTWPVM
jgi:hypothetical protein